ncbi:MAG: hypothetical protein E6J80_08985 [Deltaproteobacteria bacterium]|nr:MAG: hypothetical protein E6J80_08985 [Deltaproteobacteria bacterium]
MLDTSVLAIYLRIQRSERSGSPPSQKRRQRDRRIAALVAQKLAAGRAFLKAIEIARQQQAKSWGLRAVMSLARLWQSQGKKEEAHRMLAEIYGWFTEGFDTKDLQEAKALLQEFG